MKWNCKQTKPKRYPTDWSKWFAWHPVSTDVDSFVWLDTVERRKIIVPDPYGMHTEEWEYK